MDSLLQYVLFLFAVVFVLWLLEMRRGGSKRVFTHTYRLRQSIFNTSEAAFFAELQKQLPAGYHVYPKIRLVDFIQPLGRNSRAATNKVLAKHVDFLVCADYTKPVLAIELDGKSHRRGLRVKSDMFKNEVFAHIGLALVRVHVGAPFEQAVTHLIREHLNQNE